jgi:hypothetical protein
MGVSTIQWPLACAREEQQEQQKERKMMLPATGAHAHSKAAARCKSSGSTR